MKRPRVFTYANVMSTLAVFFVLGGASAFATTQLTGTSEGAATSGDGVLAGSKGEQFRRAVARWFGEGVPVSVSIQGDSITFGGNAGQGTYAENSYPALLQRMILGWLGGNRLEFSLVGDADDRRWSSTGTWTAVSQGPGRTALRTENGGTKSWGPAHGRQFVVYYVEEEGGAKLETRVDAGPWSVAASTNADPTEIKAAVIGAGTLADHTLSIRPGGGGPLTIVGVAALEAEKTTQFNRATRVFRLGYPGARIAKITTNLSDLDALKSGFSLPRVGLSDQKEGADLDIVAFTTNDYREQTEVGLYRSKLRGAGEAAKTLGGSVLFVAMPEPNVAPKPIPWAQYRDAMAEAAAELDAGFLDLNEPLGGRGSPLYTEAMSDELHPTALYHREIAMRIFEAIWFPL